MFRKLLSVNFLIACFAAMMQHGAATYSKDGNLYGYQAIGNDQRCNDIDGENVEVNSPFACLVKAVDGGYNAFSYDNDEYCYLSTNGCDESNEYDEGNDGAGHTRYAVTIVGTFTPPLPSCQVSDSTNGACVVNIATIRADAFCEPFACNADTMDCGQLSQKDVAYTAEQCAQYCGKLMVTKMGNTYDGTPFLHYVSNRVLGNSRRCFCHFKNQDGVPDTHCSNSGYQKSNGFYDILRVETRRCPTGSYLNANSCETCPDGYTSNPQATACAGCEAGQYLDGTQCKTCPAGYYTSENGAASCAECPLDSFAKYHTNGILDTTECAECTLGCMYGGTRSQQSCSCDCINGFSGNKCNECGLGSGFNNDTGTDKCELCEYGSVNDLISHDERCAPHACEEGFGYKEVSEDSPWDPSDVSPDSGNCVLCEEGKYSPDGQGQCVTRYCGVNEWIFKEENGGLTCKPCEAGSVVTVVRDKTNDAHIDLADSACTPCSAGKYYDNANAVCTNCVTGKYNNEKGSDLCKDCETGTYNDEEGSVSVDACKDCATGKYSEVAGSAECKSCSHFVSSAKDKCVESCNDIQEFASSESGESQGECVEKCSDSEFTVNNTRCQDKSDFLNANTYKVVKGLADCNACGGSGDGCLECSNNADKARIDTISGCVDKTELLQSLSSKNCNTA